MIRPQNFVRTSYQDIDIELLDAQELEEDLAQETKYFQQLLRTSTIKAEVF